jgi:sugar transferase (PEP-CTERM system associated)
MQRVIGNYLIREMAILGLVEAILSFAAIYTVINLAGINLAGINLAGINLAGASVTLPVFVGALPQDSLALAAVLTLVTGATGFTIGLYRADVCFDRKRLLVTTGVAAAVAFAVLLALSGGATSRFSAAHAVFIAKLMGAWLATMTLIRLVYAATTQHPAASRRIVVLGDPRDVGVVQARLRSRRGVTFRPVDLPLSEMSFPALRQHGIWGIVVAFESQALALGSLLPPLLDCKMRGMRILTTAAFQENYLGRIDLDLLTANDLLTTQGFAASRLAAALKRLSDVILSICMLVLLLPLMALTALAIKIDSPGPIFYRQKRVGQFDEPFTLYKFRSMTADAEAGGKPLWAQRQDPRITRVGRFIRATRIDELPQLANVLRGQMALVGPRPERPHFVEQLARAIPFYRHRAYVKPGVTGWAQINFPYGASVEDAREKLAYDLYYVKHRSMLLDVFILLSTVRVVLLREGAR